MRKKITLITTVGLLVFFAWFLSTKLFAQRGNTYLSLKVFSQVLGLVQRNYVHEVNSQELIESAINGMLQSLDPYSQYLNPAQYEQLRTSTEGQFGGLGIYIDMDMVAKVPLVISPIEGTPAYEAGIQPGDRIIRIEGKPTKGIILSDVIKKLRGIPGTKVTITIYREGLKNPFDCTITRAIIKIPAVLYAGVIDNNIGYVRLGNFSRSARRELEAAIDSLKRFGAKKFILDLRLNPGGLLQEGVEVSDFFLKPGKTIVVTKGKISQANREFTAFDREEANYPLVVLVDRGSASASEIVTGALQDWEKALIIGDTTFGKGSVQTLHRVEGGGALKLTTAYWYTPSGRCIDAHAAEKDTSQKGRIFHTLGHHHYKVYGWGGIVPDLIVEYPEKNRLSEELAKPKFISLLRDYAIRYARHHPNLPWGFEITEDMLVEFKGVMRGEKIKFTEAQFDSSKEYIKRVLRREIASQLWHKKGEYELGEIPYVPQIQKAIELLKESRSTEDLFRLVKKG